MNYVEAGLGALLVAFITLVIIRTVICALLGEDDD